MQTISISDKQNLTVGLSNYGARIVSIEFHGKSLALRYPSEEHYRNDPFYLGATIGPITNRIADGSLSIAERSFRMPQNEGKNTLHSGGNGVDKADWYLAYQSSNEASYQLDYPLASVGLEGVLSLSANYSVNSGTLKILYQAKCDYDTFINLTNHVYLNLDGNGNSGGDISDHKFSLLVDSYVEVDDENIPTGKLINLVPPFNYSLKSNQAGEFNGGCDHHFNVPNVGSQYEVVREIFQGSSSKSGISLRVSGNAPGFQFYTGKFLSEPFSPSAGFCVETQLPPDAINQENLDSPILKKGDIRTQITEFHFSKL